MKNTTNTVNIEILVQLEKDIIKYSALLQASILEGKALPSTDLTKIRKEYYEKAVKQLKEDGVVSSRARSIANYTIDKVLEETLETINKSN